MCLPATTVLRDVLWVTQHYLKHPVDCVCIKQILRWSTTSRRRDSLTLIKLCYLQPWHGTGHVWSVHNHTNTASRPHRTMQTYTEEHQTQNKCSHKLPDIRTVSVIFFLPCFLLLCPINHVASVFSSELFLLEKKIGHFFLSHKSRPKGEVNCQTFSNIKNKLPLETTPKFGKVWNRPFCYFPLFAHFKDAS